MKVIKEKPASPWIWIVGLAVALCGAFGYLAFRREPAEAADVVWRKAEEGLKTGQFAVARQGVETLAKLRSPTSADWMLRAQVALSEKRLDEGIENLSHVPDGEPLAPQARLTAGQVELRRGRIARAEAFFHQALALNPNLVPAHRELIYIYGMELRRPELNQEFRKLSSLTPLTFDNAFHWCLTRSTMWEPAEITELLRAWSDADPSDRWSKIALADNLRQVGKREEALKVLDSLPETDPETLVVRVRIALDRGDADTTEALLAKGPADHPELARFRGRFALSRRDGPAALRAYQIAYEADPDHRDAVFGMGQALELVGDAAAARPFLDRARKHDALNTLIQRAATPEGRKDPTLRYALGAACEALDRVPEARAWYQLAIEANPLDTEAQKSLFRLKDADTVPPPTK